MTKSRLRFTLDNEQKLKIDKYNQWLKEITAELDKKIKHDAVSNNCFRKRSALNLLSCDYDESIAEVKRWIDAPKYDDPVIAEFLLGLIDLDANQDQCFLSLIENEHRNLVQQISLQIMRKKIKSGTVFISTFEEDDKYHVPNEYIKYKKRRGGRPEKDVCEVDEREKQRKISFTLNEQIDLLLYSVEYTIYAAEVLFNIAEGASKTLISKAIARMYPLLSKKQLSAHIQSCKVTHLAWKHVRDEDRQEFIDLCLYHFHSCNYKRKREET